ncbi:unnamed protein product [Trypanosoma congolense IL3000]|uniref:WGS project CAEQ00000000 data, annotated contig 696 n=1 Tax=Trypanosoma congolense (strain IL3000) TaxID=1068625 RepID=F9WHV4_TRYCI|nr:unnamed protein product [Trypanosoma congolense IL3000]
MCGTCSGHFFWFTNTFFTKKFLGTFLKNKNKFKNFRKNLVTGSNSHMSNFFALGAIFPIFQKTKKIAKKRQNVIKKPIKPFFDVRNVFRTLFLVYQHIFHKKIFGHIFEKLCNLFFLFLLCIFLMFLKNFSCGFNLWFVLLCFFYLSFVLCDVIYIFFSCEESNADIHMIV